MTFINTTTNSTTIGHLLGVEPLVECLAPHRPTRALAAEEAWMRMVTPTASKTSPLRRPALLPVSYTHLTLPTKRIV